MPTRKKFGIDELFSTLKKALVFDKATAYQDSFQLDDGRNVNVWVTESKDTLSPLAPPDEIEDLKGLTSEDIEKILANSVTKYDDPLEPAVPLSDWEFYKE